MTETTVPSSAPPTRSDNRLLQALETLTEPALAVLSLWLLAWWHEGALTAPWLLTSLLAFALSYPGRAQLHAPLAQVAVRTLAGWAWVLALLGVLGLVTGGLRELSAQVLLQWAWLAPVMQLLAHGVLRLATPHLVRLQGPPRRAVVVGLNPQGWALAQRLSRARDAGIELVGCFDDRQDDRLPAGARRLGGLDEVADFAKAHRVRLIYLSLPMASQPRIKALLDALKDTTASVYFVPDMFVTDLIQGRGDSVCGLPLICVCETPFRGPAGLLKRASDVVLSALILALLSPLLVVIALAVKLTSPGPVIFRQRRYGLDGEEIVVWKFRSMSVVEDGGAIAQARRHDARVTRLGAFLRRTSMDELPQFFNVLQGRMSVVGPRPHAVAHNELYRTQIKSYMVRHKVRPGITGWAQVNGYRGETDSLQKMEARIRHDLDYLRHWSLWLDLRIIARTVRLVFRDRSAY